MHRDTQQGNILNKDEAWLLQEGDTKFRVESLLGTPAIKDLLHPNRVQYIEQVKKNNDNIAYTRGIIIDYDQALRIKHIQRFGFED
ncbi:MAG: outer membrane protein assembly factor BamE [Mariprofundaceae bacterium]|nr:outer membrane protein assembly factor BamE [Mariprofundaceae bacterium]